MLNGSTYFVKHNIYRDCPGIGLAKTLMISLMAVLIKKYRFISTNMSVEDLPKWDGSGKFYDGLMQTQIRIEMRE